MTDTNDKLRSVFLSLLMVMSVFAMSVAMTGATAASHSGNDVDADGHLTTGQTHWEGQELWFYDGVYSDSGTYELYEVDDVGDGETGSIVDQFSLDDDAHVVDTSGLEGDYAIQEPGGDWLDIDGAGEVSSGDSGDLDSANAFSVSPQEFSFDWDADEVGIEDNEASVEYDFDSARGSYDVNISADGLDEGELKDIFDDNLEGDESGPGGGADADVDDDMVQITGVSDGTYDANFSDIDEGEYDFEFEVPDTGATSNDTITVSETGDEDIAFVDNVVSEERGDTATIELDFSENEDEGTFVIGNESDFGYVNVVELTADDQGDTVELEFDSSAAGSDPVSVADDGNASIDSQSDDGVTGTVDEAQYDMNVSTGHQEGDLGDAATSDVATLSLGERTTDSITTMVSPDNVNEPDDIWSEVGSTVTESDEVAVGDIDDYAIFQVEASGLEGTMSDTSTDYLWNGEDNDPSDDQPINISVSHESPGPNQDPGHLDLTDDVTYRTDAANDTYFVAVDLGSLDVSDGEDYQTNFTVTEEGPADDRETLLANWSTVDADAELDTEEVDGDDMVVVNPSDNQSVTGETNVAPGTEVTAFMQATDAETPFLITPDTTVQEDGSFEATTSEFADRAIGGEFDAEVRIDNNDLGDTYDGVIQEATETDTPADGTDTPADGTDTPADGTDTPGDMTDEPDGDDTPTPTEEPTPGFGIAVSLIALIGAALLAARRYN